MVMPRAYSADLRERVLVACEEEGLSRAAAARRYRVGERTVYRWLHEAHHDGRRCAKPHAGGPRPRVAGGEEVLHQLVATRNDATLAEQAELYEARTGRKLSPSTLCRAFRRLGLTRKKRHSGPTNRTAKPSGRSGRPSPRGWPASTPTGGCSSTRPASPPT